MKPRFEYLVIFFNWSVCHDHQHQDSHGYPPSPDIICCNFHAHVCQRHADGFSSKRRSQLQRQANHAVSVGRHRCPCDDGCRTVELSLISGVRSGIVPDRRCSVKLFVMRSGLDVNVDRMCTSIRSWSKFCIEFLATMVICWWPDL